MTHILDWIIVIISAIGLVFSSFMLIMDFIFYHDD